MLSERKPQPLVEGNEVKGVGGIDPIFAKLRLSRLPISVNGDLGTAGAEPGLDRANEHKQRVVLVQWNALQNTRWFFCRAT